VEINLDRRLLLYAKKEIGNYREPTPDGKPLLVTG